MKRILLFLLFAILVAGIIPSCGGGGGDSPFTPTDLAGSYNLAELKIIENGATVTLKPPSVYGTLTLTAAGTFTSSFAYPAQNFSETDGGTYFIDDATITFRWTDGDTETGTLAEGGLKIVITVNHPEESLVNVWTYVKQ